MNQKERPTGMSGRQQRDMSKAIRLSALASVALVAIAPVSSFAEKLPVEDFARDFAYSSVKLSPSGRYIAAARPSNGTTNLAVVDLETGKGTALTGYKHPDEVVLFGWKSDERLLYAASTHDEWSSTVPTIAAIGVDGRNHIQVLANPQLDGRYIGESVLDWLPEDPAAVLLVSASERADYPIVYRVNVQALAKRTTRAGGFWPTARKPVVRLVARNCEFVQDLNGAVRICVTREQDNSSRLLYLPSGESDWKEIASFDFDEGYIWPLGFAPDNRRLYVLSNVGRDTLALYLYDPDLPKLGELLFEAPGVDVQQGVFAGNLRRLIGVSYYMSNPAIHYIDPEVERLHRAIIAAFPKSQSSFESFSLDGKHAIVRTQTPQTPGSFFLFDVARMSAAKVLDIAPWIDPERMGTVRAIAFDARDGLRIQGYLTLPRDRPAKNLPLIVNAHGGPHGVRDVAEFDRETQLFASRGYAVLQINFRGSGGYGAGFRAAGYGEWGRKMQDDLADGVKWAIAEGVADPGRIGIFGGSYGGYAAMMGLITSPELFKCGITYAGVSDVMRLLNRRTVRARTGLYRRVGSDERLFWEAVIGDRKDEASLKQISPVYNVDKIKVPVFIAHGAMDLIVSIDDATDLRDALKRRNSEVEYLEFEKEEHGFSRPENRTEFYRRMDAFLAKHLPSE